jgi:hypothetical protein
MPFSVKSMWNPYSVWRRCGRARLDERFERAITFDPTVGSRSNFYWSFKISFSMKSMWNPYSEWRRCGRARLE